MQVKKPEIRAAILEAAFRLFSTKGYASTTLPQIAQLAGVSTTNLYSYFDSKLTILYSVHGPWIQAAFDELDAQLDALHTPREKLSRIFTALLHEMPARQQGFANNIIQALAMARPEDPYRPNLMSWLEDRLLGMLGKALPGVSRETLDRFQLAHFLMMAFDGYIVYHRVAPDRGCDPATVDWLTDAMLAFAAQARERTSEAGVTSG